MKRFCLCVTLAFVLTSSAAFADHFGPVASPLHGGQMELSLGYSYGSSDWEPDDAIIENIKLKQNTFYAQLGMGFGGNWEAYIRGGFADCNAEDAFRFSNENSTDSFLPFGTFGLRGPLFHWGEVTIGPFFQGSYYSTYEDVMTNGVIREKISLDKMWEANLGIAFQGEFEGAHLYGGPFYYMSNTEYRSVASAGTVVDVVDADLEKKDNLGVYLGVRWPLAHGFSIDLETQLKNSATIGTAIYYAF